MNWLKNLIFGNEAPAQQLKPQAPKEDPQARYLRDTLVFAKQQHKELRHKQNEHERWQQHYGSLHIDELKNSAAQSLNITLPSYLKAKGI